MTDDQEPTSFDSPDFFDHFDVGDLRWKDVADEALSLVQDYVSVPARTDELYEWVGEQLRLLAIADAQGDTDFIRDYPRAVALVAKSKAVRIARGREALVRDRFVLVTRLALRVLSAV